MYVMTHIQSVPSTKWSGLNDGSSPSSLAQCHWHSRTYDTGYKALYPVSQQLEMELPEPQHPAVINKNYNKWVKNAKRFWRIRVRKKSLWRVIILGKKQEQQQKQQQREKEQEQQKKQQAKMWLTVLMTHKYGGLRLFDTSPER